MVINMSSIWADTCDLPEFPQLQKDIRTQVLIIGGGITGILCAYFLQQAGVDYCLLEKERICKGITSNTTAKITAQHGLTYARMLRGEGREKAGMYLKANRLAVKHYRDLGWFIDCDMEEKDSYVYTRNNRTGLERELEALTKLGYEAGFTEHLTLPFETAGAVVFPKQLQFHPLKFVSAISKNLNIYENSGVREMTEYFALTEHGSVAAEKVIIATHFPFINTRGNYYLKLYQKRAYVAALENAGDVNGMYIDGEEGGLSLRNYKNLLLLGGGSHRTGKPGGGYEEVKKAAEEYWKGAKVVGEWATQDCMSLDRIPYIGPYSRSTPDLYVGTGYNKWGMTGAMLSAMLLSDAIQEKENEFAPLFSPGRNIIKPQLAVNAWEAARGILRFSGHSRCSHMGCVLQWNSEEKTWDCPCHGSRFDKEGKLLDNPAVDGIPKIKKEN